jgi:hypothetical protein
MGARHVAEHFSAAYDGELSAAERRRYEEHLAACAECTAAAEQFRQAIDAVHAMPAAQMPQRVVLPSTPPQVEPGRGLGARLRELLPALRLTPAWGAGVMAAAGIVAVVLVVHGHSGGGVNSTASAPLSDQQQVLGQNAAGGAARKSSPIGVGTCPLPQAVVTAQPGAVAADPPGFANRVSVGDPKRPGQQLVLATTSGHYAPGSQVLVYAALTTPSGQHATVIPCVTLHDQGAVAFLPGAGTMYGASGGIAAQGSSADTATGTSNGTSGSGSGAAGPGSAPTPSPQASGAESATAMNGSAQHPPGAQAPAAIAPPLAAGLSPLQYQAFSPYTLQPPLAIAAPTAAAVANLPLQVLQIPAGITPGTQLRLVALIPAGFPGNNDSAAVEAVLTIVVS